MPQLGMGSTDDHAIFSPKPFRKVRIVVLASSLSTEVSMHRDGYYASLSSCLFC